MRNKIPRISIVTPSLNQGKFLQQCIDSIIEQGWADLEYFIIDGGSTDETINVLERNSHKITKIIVEKDDGAADAINKGIDLCTGEIIAWLNADDYYLPGAFKRLIEAWELDPTASFWFGNGYRVTEYGGIKCKFNKNKIIWNRKALVEGLDYILQPATFMNATILKEVGKINKNLKWSFDWDLWIRMSSIRDPIPINNELSATREWGETLTANGGFRRVEELRMLAARHSGKPVTLGAMCYWLDEVHRTQESSQRSGNETIDKIIIELWSEVQLNMQTLGVDENGMPVCTGVWGEKMIIAIDLYPLIVGVSGGIVPWINGVLRQLIRLHPNDKIVLFHRGKVAPLNLNGINVHYISLSENPTEYYSEVSVHCNKLNVQVLIRTYPQENHPNFSFEKQIFIIPDIQHEFFPEFFDKQALIARRKAFAFALSRGAAIATMTNHSRETIINNPWTDCKDVFLIPASLQEELAVDVQDIDVPDEVKDVKNFFYMPANLWPHKNHRRLFEAFSLALPQLPNDTKLVLTGSIDGYKELIKDYGNLPVIHLGFLPHKQVAALFKKSIALVYFSLFEGFGMPLLEAFYHGTPVLCSNTTSLPEVGGNAVLSCDPTNVDDMACLMVRIVNETGLRSKLATNTQDRLNAYDWTKPAEELHSALERVVNRNKLDINELPLISIVMPTRNHAKFIRLAVDSVLEQDYNNVQLIVMDGNSTDNTVDILKEYGSRIQWVSENDSGQTDAINKGMRIAKGDILAYLNSDDILLPGALSAVAEYFKINAECDLIYGNAEYIDVDGKLIGSYATENYSFNRLMQDCCICQPATFWKRRIAERVGEFNETLQTAMDYEYWLRVANAGGIIHRHHKILAQSRLHEDAKTLSMRGIIFKEIFNICKEQGGYVSYSYHVGLWSYKLYEKSSIGKWLKRILPRLHTIPAFIQYTSQFSNAGNSHETRILWARTIYQVTERKWPKVATVIRVSYNKYRNLKLKVTV